MVVLDNASNEEAENNTKDLNDIKPTQICSPNLARPILASPRFGSTSLTNTSNSILRPSHLSSINTTRTSTGGGGFSLNPSRLNPFTKPTNSDASDEKTTANNVSHTNGETPKFVPLLQNSENSKTPVVIKPVTTAVPTSTISQASNFVFGQNLEERVIADNNSKIDEPKPSTSVNSNGSVDMLFTTAASKAEVANSVQNKENSGK